jgi:hypothetical protein
MRLRVYNRRLTLGLSSVVGSSAQRRHRPPPQPLLEILAPRKCFLPKLIPLSPTERSISLADLSFHGLRARGLGWILVGFSSFIRLGAGVCVSELEASTTFRNISKWCFPYSFCYTHLTLRDFCLELLHSHFR